MLEKTLVREFHISSSICAFEQLGGSNSSARIVQIDFRVLPTVCPTTTTTTTTTTVFSRGKIVVVVVVVVVGQTVGSISSKTQA